MPAYGENTVAEHTFALILAFDVNRNQLLGNSDIVTLHAPAIPATHHLINKDTLSQMRQGALLIDTVRGFLVDTAALAEALDEGRLGGAGLDVFEGEEFMQHEGELLYRPAPRTS